MVGSYEVLDRPSASTPLDFPSVVVIDRARMTIQFGHWSCCEQSQSRGRVRAHTDRFVRVFVVLPIWRNRN